jgi:CheY-like chemotaxis protein
MDDWLRRPMREQVELETVLAAGLRTTLADPHQLKNVISGLAGGGAETILVVEGDLAVRAVVVGMPQSLGFRGVRANDALAAMTMLSKPYRRRTLRGRSACCCHPRGPGCRAGGNPPGHCRRGVGSARCIRRAAGMRCGRPSLAHPAGRGPGGPARKTVPLLELLGCEMKAVGSAEAAEPVLATSCFDVLMTDVPLPGRSGIALAHDAHERQPHMMLVMCSGFGGALELPPGVQAEILPKPYSMPRPEACSRVCRRTRVPSVAAECGGLQTLLFDRLGSDRQGVRRIPWASGASAWADARVTARSALRSCPARRMPLSVPWKQPWSGRPPRATGPKAPGRIRADPVPSRPFAPRAVAQFASRRGTHQPKTFWFSWGCLVHELHDCRDCLRAASGLAWQARTRGAKGSCRGTRVPLSDKNTGPEACRVTSEATVCNKPRRRPECVISRRSASRLAGQSHW